GGDFFWNPSRPAGTGQRSPVTRNPSPPPRRTAVSRWPPPLPCLPPAAPLAPADPPPQQGHPGAPRHKPPPDAPPRLGTARFRLGGLTSALSLAPDGKRLAAGFNQNIRLLDTATGKEAAQIKVEQFGVNSIAFTPDGKSLVTRSYNNRIQVWEADGGKLVSTV